MSRLSLPSHWIRGQLIDLKRYTDHSYRATLLGEEWKPTDKDPAHDVQGLTKMAWEDNNALFFASSHDAQEFISNWYAQSQAKYG